jgi:lysozyme
MKISDKGIKFIQGWEALRPKKYWDDNDGWTIGWGHLIKDNENIPNIITLEQATELLKNDLIYFENIINKYVSIVLTQNQFDALVSLVFNIGEVNFRKSTLLKKLNLCDFEGAGNQFWLWRKDDGKIVEGLVKRRTQEKDVFVKNIYKYEH